jgi:trimeric autotransporter adhesin
MTRTRFAFLNLFLLTIVACGGRSSLHVETADGGGLADAKRDVRLDAGSDGIFAPDVPADLPTDLPPPQPDIPQPPDNRPNDLPPSPDVARVPDVPAVEVPRLPDARPLDLGRSDNALPDLPRPDLPSDTRDARDAGPETGDVAPSLSLIELSPPSPTIVVGVPYTGFLVTAVYSDGTSSDVTATATYASSDTSVIQVTGHTLNGQKAGSATITATFQGRTATARVTVSASPLQSISIDGVAPVSVGQFILITATGLFADGTKQDITTQATWASADTTLATVGLDTATSKEKVTGVKAGGVTVSAVLQGITGKATITVTTATISRIDVTPAQPILQKGVSQAFQATASYSDGTTGDVTSQATWASDTAAVATVSASATGVLVRAVGAGSATISATVGTVVGSTTVTVTTPTLLSIAVTPGTWSPNVGGKQAFTAVGTYSDKTTADLTLSVSWASSNTNVVAISNAAGQKGQATALDKGTADIQATLAGVTATVPVTVSASPLTSIVVKPDPLNLILGIKGTLIATGNYQNGTTQDLTSQVAWSVSDANIASISNAAGTAGQITGLALGTTSAVATLAGVAGKAVVNVSEAKLTSIAITPATATVSAGAKQQYTAIGTYDNGTTPDLTTQVTWSSSDIRIAQISNAAGSNGLATSLVQGTATITASLAGVSATATLTVGAPQLSSIMISPITASLEVGGTQSFTATAVYQNGTTAAVAATWTSTPETVATVASNGGGRRGVATGVAAGTATVTATYQGMSDTATLTVTAVPTLVGLTITPTNPATLLVGGTQQFQANAVYSNGNTTGVTTTATWTSSDANVASVSSGGGGPGGGRGLVTGIGAGTAEIQAVYNGYTATVTVTVRAPTPTGLLVTPTTATIRVNGTQQFAAVVTLEDGTTQTVTNSATWTTSSGTIASITTGGGGPGGGAGRGLATGVSAGSVSVVATYGTFTAKATLTVTSAKASSLVVTPATATIQVGQAQAFVATLVYDDNTTAIVTAQATWTSSEPGVAVVSNTTGGGPGGPGGATGGTATALAIGSSTITATYSELSGSATLTVVDPPLSSVQVTPTNPSIPVGATRQFTATAVFSDNSIRDVTAQATWSSSDSAVSVVLSSGPTAGRASAVAEGKATITATYKGVSGTTVLAVAGSVQSVSITPTNPTTAVGLPVNFSATALLSNGSTLVVTNDASWVSSDPTVATITANGAATPIKSGTVTIAGGYLGKSGSTTLTISTATLSSIAITPKPVSLAKGATQNLTATGNYSDGTTYDLTNVVTWLSSDSTIAPVSNATGSHGLLSAAAAGNATVTATFQNVTSAADAVKVTP